MKSFAKVAVITRTKNRPITLKRAIESVASQTYSDYLHVIVNDGGESKVVEDLVESSRNKEKTLILHNETSLGMEAASNAGIRMCDSEYILIHDDDDSLHPEFLEKTVAFLENNSSLYCAVSSWITLVRESLSEHGIVRLSERLYGSLRSVSLGQMAASNQLVPIAFLYRRQLHSEIGYYDETLPVLGDWDFFLRVLEKHEIGILPEQLAFYHQRVSADGIYANSLTGANDKHAAYSQLVRNKLFRRELESGKSGVGFLSQMSSMMLMLPMLSVEYYIKSVVFQISANKPLSLGIYGIGNIGAQLYTELKTYSIDVGCFIENDNKLTHELELFMGIPVYSMKDAILRGYFDIAIGSWEYKNIIIDRIHKEVDVNKLRLRLYSV